MVSYKETLLKTFIWRVCATLLTVATAWIITGDYMVGLTIGGVEVVVKLVGYFSFERLWEFVKRRIKNDK